MARLVVLALALAPAVLASRAHAYGRGIDVSDCTGCHAGGRAPVVRIVADPAAPAPGDVVRLAVEIEARNGPAGGFHLRSSGPGSFRVVTGSGTRLLGEDAIVHTAPAAARDGWVRFEVDWLAPAAPGDVQLRAAALSANGDGTSRGDLGASSSLGLVFGCAGVVYYPDLDADGWGASSRGSIVACAMPEGYSARGDDCDDNERAEHPGADELCDAEDDDCDGAVDEGLEVADFYPDADGDGWGGRTGEPVMGCGRSGYGLGDRDCDDRDPTIFPGAPEVCDGRDDDCDFDVDERVRPICGLGWCRREASGCDATDCTPGEPRAETCNAFDDDCDGEVDEDVPPCAGGGRCELGVCVAGTDGGGSDGGARAPASGGCSTGAPSGAPWALLSLVVALATIARRARSGSAR